MAISFVGIGSPGGGTGDVTPTLPASVQEQDFMLLLVETGGAVDGGEAVSIPSGWTSLGAAGPAQGTSGQGATRLSMFYRFYQTGDGNPTITDPGDHVISQIAAFRGVDLASPATTRQFSSSFNATTRTSAAVSAVADQLLCIIGVNSLNQTPTITNSAGLTQTQRVSLSTTNGDDGALRFYTAPVASAASITGTTTVTSSDAVLVCAFALNPLSTITVSSTPAMGSFGASGTANQLITQTATAAMGSFSATATADQIIPASATAALGGFSATATGDQLIVGGATVDLGAFATESDIALIIAADVVADLGAFEATGDADLPLFEAEVVADMGAFEATANAFIGELVTIEVDAAADIVGFGAGLIWVFVGRLEVPGDADYNITVPKLFRVIDISGIERTAKVPGLNRTLQVP